MSESFRIYKPNKRGNGAASKIEFRWKSKIVHNKEGKEVAIQKAMVFWQAVQQTGQDENNNASFGWEDPSKTIIIKLGDPDIGEILAVLAGKKDYVGLPPKQEGSLPPGLFHKNPNGNSTISFSRVENGFRVKCSKQTRTDRNVVSVQHLITLSEAEVLQVILKKAIELIYGW